MRAPRSKQPALTLKQTATPALMTPHARKLDHAVREQDDDIVKSKTLSSSEILITLKMILATLAITPVSLSKSLSKSHLTYGSHFMTRIKGSSCAMNQSCRLTLQKQRDDIGNSFRQILFGNTRKSSYNMDCNTDNDNINCNTDNDDMNCNTDNDNIDSNTDDDNVDKSDSEQKTDYMDKSDDKDVEEPYPSLRCSLASSLSSSIYKQCGSSNTTGVAPISSPSACSQIEDLKDSFVGALTKRHSLTQLYEWLTSIKYSVNTSLASKWITMVPSHFTQHLTFQLAVTKLSLNTLPFSIQLNPSPLAWSGYAKYENFKPWKTKKSFHPRHPHCWFCALAATIANPPPQHHLRSNRLRNKPCTIPFSLEKYTTTANLRRMR